MSCAMIDCARGIVSETRSGIKTIAAVCCVSVYVRAALRSICTAEKRISRQAAVRGRDLRVLFLLMKSKNHVYRAAIYSESFSPGRAGAIERSRCIGILKSYFPIIYLAARTSLTTPAEFSRESRRRGTRARTRAFVRLFIHAYSRRVHM